MKNIITILISIAFLSCVSNGSNGREISNEVSFTKEYTVSTPLNMKIVTSGGDVRVSGYNGDVVTVNFIVKKLNKVMKITLEELKNIADVDITNDGNIFEIIVEKAEMGVSVGFDIKTPEKSACILKTSGGDMSASRITGNQDFRTSGGDITLISITGKVEAHTSGGDIIVKDQKGDILVKTSGGDIKVENNEGKLDAHTSGGDIKISNSHNDVIASTNGGDVHLDNVGGIIDASTSGGSIKMTGVSGTVTASTSGGSIDADFIKPGDAINLKTSGGGIDLSLPDNLGLNLSLRGNRVKADLKNFSGQAEKDKVVGKINGGGTYVSASTSGGDVSLNFK